VVASGRYRVAASRPSRVAAALGMACVPPARRIHVPTTRMRFTVAVCCAAILAVAAGGRSPARAAAADFTRYHTYEELTAALKAAVAAHPDLAKLISIGKTREGATSGRSNSRSRAGPPVDTRPACSWLLLSKATT